MRRREFITLLGGAAAWPLAAHAQQSAKIPRIGIIDDAPIWDHFRRGLRDEGYLERREIAFEYRSADGQPERLAAAAKELAAVPVDIIVTSGTAATRAAQQATSTIPRHDRHRRSGTGRTRAQPGTPRWKHHRQFHARRRNDSQAHTDAQGAGSAAVAIGFPVEPQQRLSSRLSRRVARGST
jgi:ABC transporter substrate binding protein